MRENKNIIIGLLLISIFMCWAFTSIKLAQYRMGLDKVTHVN